MVVRALVAQGSGRSLGLAAMRGADEGDDAVAGMELVLEHLRHAAPIEQEAALDHRFGSASAEDGGDFVRQPGQPGGGAGEEDAGLAGGGGGHGVSLTACDRGIPTVIPQGWQTNIRRRSRFSRHCDNKVIWAGSPGGTIPPPIRTARPGHRHPLASSTDSRTA